MITRDDKLHEDVDITVIKYYDKKTGRKRFAREEFCYGVSVREQNDTIYVTDKNGKEHKVKLNE